MKALVVDDSRAMRVLLTRMLREIGFEVTEAGDGSEALQALRSEKKIDIALVDWNMPEMSGFEFIREVRRDKAFDRIRLMMVTTECGMDEIITALKAGADDYIMKPFTRDVIREKLAVLGIAGVESAPQ